MAWRNRLRGSDGVVHSPVCLALPDGLDGLRVVDGAPVRFALPDGSDGLRVRWWRYFRTCQRRRRDGAGCADVLADGAESAEGRLRAVCAILDGMDADGLQLVDGLRCGCLGCGAFDGGGRCARDGARCADGLRRVCAEYAQRLRDGAERRDGARCADMLPDGSESVEWRLRAVCAILDGMDADGLTVWGMAWRNRLRGSDGVALPDMAAR